MDSFQETFLHALRLLVEFDPDLYAIIGRTFQVSLSALAIALVLGLGLAGFLALNSFRGKNLIMLLLHTLLGAPPVVIGLLVYLLFSFQGPLGDWELLFTPSAMITAQVILILPIVASYGHDALREAWQNYQDQLRSLGANKWQSAWVLIHDCRYHLVLITLSGFGRAISEVGAVIIVGGNILHHTRVMTTSITLAISRGQLDIALALGGILFLMALAINLTGFVLRQMSDH